MRERRRIHQRTYRVATVMVVAMLVLLSGMAYGESGRINLIFANGAMSNSENITSFEFDVKAYISDGSDVLGEGMVYVKYPVDVFGDCIVYNEKVTVEKIGLLSGTDDIANRDLYRFVNITDTYSDVFAVTFGAAYYQTDMKAYYESISTDPENPSDLLHISMVVSQEADGSVSFPGSMPGLNSLYFDYEYAVFDGGLDVSNTLLALNYSTEPGDPTEDPITPPVTEPVFAGSVDLSKFSARVKKTTAELGWRTEHEIDIASYLLERSDNGSTYETVADVIVKSSKTKFNAYSISDVNLVPGAQYTYKLTAIDMNGSAKELSTQNVFVPESKHMIMDDGLFALEASYPNPFNPSFVVPFSVTSSQNVDIRLYDLNGKLIQTVADGYYSPGNHKIHVSCDGMASGVYLLVTHVNEQKSIQKMLLTK